MSEAEHDAALKWFGRLLQHFEALPDGYQVLVEYGGAISLFPDGAIDGIFDRDGNLDRASEESLDTGYYKDVIPSSEGV